MKIGIITFHAVYNFGAALQAMALQNYLIDKNHTELEFVDYQIPGLKHFYSLNPIYGGPRMCFARLIRLNKRACQARAFQNFKKKYMKLSEPVSDKNLEQKLKEYDVLIFGSDQIWNNNITGNTSFYYAGQVEKNIKKIAYAASFGTDICNEFQVRCIKKYLPAFSTISVRETQAKKYIDQYLDVNVEVVVDPVFLLGQEYWVSWISNIEKRSNPYILFYSLQHSNQLIESATELANKYNLEIISIHPTAQKQRILGKQLYNVGPKQFVSLIYYAAYICTDSFHAVAFSCLFEKKVVYFGHSKFSSRVDSLISLIGVEQKHCEDIIDFSLVDKSKIEKIKRESECFLLNSLQ